jgi:1-acyl-sn-glycerol-3-phosphate acyltransferase
VRTLARLLYRVEIEWVPLPAGGLVLAANHESVLDPFFLGLVTRRPVHFFAKAELWRYRPVAAAMDALGAIPVERGLGDREALAKAAAVVRGGGIVGIFPQGTVRGGVWQRGAARIALMAGAPIAPVRIVGTGRALARRRVGFPRIRVRVGSPIEVSRQERPSIAVARDLTERVMASVGDLY